MDTARLAARTRRAPGPVFALILGVCAGACRADPDAIVLGATTSTYDSGLLEHLISRFNDDHPGVRVRTVIAGSGEALELGRTGDVDLLLVHAPDAEARFIAAGHAPRRRPVMYNSFVIVGPPGDPARIREAESPAEAFATIARDGHRFVSRGDSSGTHYREVALWREAGVTTRGAWYVESGQGQATTLHVANERTAYALTDGATLTVLSDVLELEALVADHPALRNVYSLLEPRAALRAGVAAVLADWFLSETGRRAIDEFRVRGGDEPLFIPWTFEDAAPPDGAPALEGNSLSIADSGRGSAARGSPAHHVG
ncbi:substrate-binding domain-containing protein [Candidatus Palauibacter sp.]|uniref:substrate-binding domain-containing protein n=1 Tax=Candidatus Palauibacter sp. TaxID=3101350 RepID=UPI003B59B200